MLNAGKRLFGMLFNRNKQYTSFKMTEEWVTFDHLEQTKGFSPNFKRGIEHHGNVGFNCVSTITVKQKKTGRTNIVNLFFETNEYRSLNLTIIELDAMVKWWNTDTQQVVNATSKIMPVLEIPESKKEVVNSMFVHKEFEMEI